MSRPHLGDVFDTALFEEALREGLVVRRDHPSEPLAILNYTQKTTFARAWNPCTLACRGIVYRRDTGEVVARPFRKFFNLHEPDAPQLDPTAPAVVTDKLDGSLGVLYRVGSGHALSTRGSFTSDQAVHGTGVWRERYARRFAPPPGWTVLFEIVYPDNRIVVDYGATDDLILLGAVEVATGRTVPPDAPILEEWPGPRAAVFPHATLADALSAPPRPNAEGFVVHQPDTDQRIKLKQEDYVALHRLVTGLNERTVWEHLRAGGSVDALVEGLPEEFHDWTRSVAARLEADVQRRATEVERTFAEILSRLPSEHTRKDFALAAVRTPLRSHLFARLDGKDYAPLIWDAVKPEAMRGPRSLGDDE